MTNTPWQYYWATKACPYCAGAGTYGQSDCDCVAHALSVPCGSFNPHVYTAIARACEDLKYKDNVDCPAVAKLIQYPAMDVLPIVRQMTAQGAFK